MARAKMITNIRKYLKDENIYTDKDEMTLVLLENTYSQYIQAWKDVKKNGLTIEVSDSNGKIKRVANPSYRIQNELLKELQKLGDALYLTPKSRKTQKETTSKENPFIELMKNIG